MRPIVRLALAITACALAACRSSPPPPEVWEREPDYYLPHDVLGHVHKPDSRRLTTVPEHPDGAVELRTNGLGFRNDRNPTTPKPVGTWRALVVGDSHTDGVVDNRDGVGDALARVLEIDRREQGIELRAEVINGGTGYWGPAQYAEAFSVWAALEPDLCIVILYEGNDFLDAVDANLMDLKMLSRSVLILRVRP